VVLRGKRLRCDTYSRAAYSRGSLKDCLGAVSLCSAVGGLGAICAMIAIVRARITRSEHAPNSHRASTAARSRCVGCGETEGAIWGCLRCCREVIEEVVGFAVQAVSLFWVLCWCSVLFTEFDERWWKNRSETHVRSQESGEVFTLCIGKSIQPSCSAINTWLCDG
jgi:hypothetical protein